MSFRNDDSRRYGHVPPAQYPVAGSSQDQSARRSSFNNGDDAGFFDQASNRVQIPSYQANSGRAEEELFITSPTIDQQSPPPRPAYNTQHVAQHIATAGYQSQSAYQPTQTPSAYNPQQFARSQSTSAASHAYHPGPPARYPTAASPTAYNSPPSSYTPQAYNPAAYANTNSSLPHRQATVAGYGNYGYSYSSPAVPQAASAYGHASGSAYSASQYAQAPTSPPQPAYEPAMHSPQYTPSAAPSALSPSYDQTYHSSYGSQQYLSSQASNGGSPNPNTYAPSTSQAPYPVYSQIPVGPAYSATDSNSYVNRASRSNSHESPLPSPPTQSQISSGGLQRHPTNAPLPSRPIDDIPDVSRWRSGSRDSDNDPQITQESLIQDIVSDLGVAPHGHRPRPVNGSVPGDDLDMLRRYNSTATTIDAGSSSVGVGRHGSSASTLNRNDIRTTFGHEDDDYESDPEGAAGLLAMQDDLDDRRFGGASVPFHMGPPAPQQTGPTHLSPTREEASSDSDFGGMDLGLYGGGYAGNLQYGTEVGSPPATVSTFDGSRPLPHPQSRSGDYAVFSEASVDYGGTGGLQAPQVHRLSFDEGDEQASIHSRQSGSESPLKEDYPDMFYHPGLTNRPLPALPPELGNSLAPAQSPHRASYQPPYPSNSESRLSYAEDAYQAHLSSQQYPERSISLSSHSHTPPIQTPARSRTDAAEERRKAMKHMAHQLPSQPGTHYEGYETGTAPSLAAYDMITLPTGRRKKFTPSKLTSEELLRCKEPWALSGITAWIREMAEGEPDLKRKSIEEGVLRLFTFTVPTMNVADAESLSASVVDTMFAAGILIPEEEWVKFGSGQLSGVLWQLTGHGCYAPKLHENEEQAPRLHDNGVPVRCYSNHCGRTLKKANLDNMMSEEDPVSLDWASFFNVPVEVQKEKGKKEVERQNVLHEIVTGEEDYMGQLDVLRVLYRDQLRGWEPPIIAPNRRDGFLEEVFGKVDAVQQINKEHLLAQLKYRQQEQGPWIVGFSDLFREWIRKARPVYIEYCSAFPHASYSIRKEANRNVLFRQFLDMVREHPRSRRLEWTTFVKAPITRLQRYGLLLDTVKKNMVGESEEKANLIRALEEIKAVTHECDEKVAEETKKVELRELQHMLVLRPGFQSVLNLDHLGRELLKQGELQRAGSKGMRLVDIYALLFDHYFILAKTVVQKDGRSGKKYDVSKEPIPMPLLFLESTDDDPVSKQKGITAPLGRTTAVTGSGTQLNKTISNGVGRPGLEHATTGSSIGSLSTVTRLPTGGSDDARTSYPFKIKHLGHEIYTLHCSTVADRAAWCQAIIDAKTRHARALHAQNAEPFRLRVLSDGAFAYEVNPSAAKQQPVSIRGTPLDRAIREMEKVYGPGRGPPPVCRAQVNCATAFTAFGKSMIAIGTDYGVYISEASNPRGWSRSVQLVKVTQIAVLEDFSVCLFIADKALLSYPLETVVPVSNFPAPAHDNSRRAPQRLAKDVAFFATARMKDRMLLFYKRKEGMHNTFRVLEPVFQKATEKKTRLFGGRRSGPGSTESFRDFDEFYIPAECYSLNLFQTYIAVASAKGFEMLTLDKKQTQSIPRDLNLPAIANIASRIKDQRPLGMFRLNDQEFLLTYEDCAVYVDKHGEISRTLIMEYSGKQKKAKAATMFGQYLVLFNEDYVEVRNAENGRLRQIIAGRDVRCLDYGFRGPTGNGSEPPVGQDSKGTVKICMNHPEVLGQQIVLEMVLNDGHAEKS
ncbi:Rho1 guanine nucleotide exchange factor 3 [Echria macrotheca]|uniref:Rho1 guanine nucleotide exchange factor 3 n=1 Tax=Echria macrotheca TaxID=438768 RepID=A0AAJ0B239_9PEZI|nr:Rho1 guanine nucleotide exchange factor 3 [Echria macrotheca]